MTTRLKSALTLTNLVSGAAALLLTASPWIGGFIHDAIATGNAILCGLLLLCFTTAALFQLRDWRGWMNLVPGVWVLLSPLILEFAAHEVPAAIHVVVGLIVSILALIELCRTETLCLDD